MPQAGNVNFPTLIAATIDNYSATMTDNILNNERLFKIMKEKGFIEGRTGGVKIVEPLLIDKNSTVRSFNGFDLLDRSHQYPLTAAEYEWKQIHGALGWSGREKFQNSGKSQMISILKARMAQLEKSFMIYLSETLYADGSGNGGKDVTGLAAAVEDGTAWSTYGNINSDTNTWWRNQYIGTVGSYASNGRAKLSQLIDSCSRGNETSDILITTQTIFEAHEALLVDHFRTMSPGNNDLGFPYLMYRGIPLVWDQLCPSGTLYALMTKYMRLVIGEGRDFSMSPLKRAEYQDAEYSDVFMILQLILSNRARQGMMNGIS